MVKVNSTNVGSCATKHTICVIPAEDAKSKFHHEEILDGPKLRDVLQNS